MSGDRIICLYYNRYCSTDCSISGVEARSGVRNDDALKGAEWIEQRSLDPYHATVSEIMLHAYCGLRFDERLNVIPIGPVKN